MTPAKTLQKARAQLVLTQPFFGTLARRLRLTETPGLGTMATDGTEIKYDPAFVETPSMAELSGVLTHEVMHCALLHHTRRGTRDAKLWNIACDYAVNPILIDAGMTLPQGVLVADRFRALSAEAIYAQLTQDAHAASGEDECSGEANALDPGRCGAVIDAPAASLTDTARTEQEWRIAITQATQAARKAGTLTEGLAEAVEQIKTPQADWRSLLRRFLDQLRPTDYRWLPPNRRFIAQGIYLPSLGAPGIGSIAIAIDTSASIDTDLLATFGAEVRAVLEDLTPPEATVIYFDTKVHQVETITDPMTFELNAIGRGGTDLRAPFDHIDTHSDALPSALIVFTDLEGPMPEGSPGYPVLWAAYQTRDVAAFGETIHLEAEQ